MPARPGSCELPALRSLLLRRRLLRRRRQWPRHLGRLGGLLLLAIALVDGLGDLVAPGFTVLQSLLKSIVDGSIKDIRTHYMADAYFGKGSAYRRGWSYTRILLSRGTVISSRTKQ